jgi:hypothetical protein
MSRLRWASCSMAIVAILAAVTVAVSTRHAPGSTTFAVRGTETAAWAAHVAAVDRALDAHDVGLASRRWRDAYGLALRSRQWEPMLAAGEAALRVGHAAGPMSGFEAEARQCFLTALFRARAQQSLDGVLLAAEAFEGLGDVAVARGALRMADALTLATRDVPRGTERVTALRKRLNLAGAGARDAALLPEE